MKGFRVRGHFLLSRAYLTLGPPTASIAVADSHLPRGREVKLDLNGLDFVNVPHGSVVSRNGGPPGPTGRFERLGLSIHGAQASGRSIRLACQHAREHSRPSRTSGSVRAATCGTKSRS